MNNWKKPFILMIFAGLFLQSCSIYMDSMLGLQEASPEQIEEIGRIVKPVVPEYHRPVSPEVEAKVLEYLEKGRSEIMSRAGMGRLAMSRNLLESMQPSYAILALIWDDYLTEYPDEAEQVVRILYHRNIESMINTRTIGDVDGLLNTVAAYYAATQQSSALIGLREAYIDLGNYFGYSNMVFTGEAGIAAYAVSIGDRELFAKRAARALDQAGVLIQPDRASTEHNVARLRGLTYEQALERNDPKNELTEITGRYIAGDYLFPFLIEIYNEAVFQENDQLILRLTGIMENSEHTGRANYQIALMFAAIGDIERARQFSEKAHEKYNLHKEFYENISLNRWVTSYEKRLLYDTNLAQSLIRTFTDPVPGHWDDISQYAKSVQKYEDEWIHSRQYSGAGAAHYSFAERIQAKERAHQRWSDLAGELDTALSHEEVMKAYVPFLQSDFYDAGPFLMHLLQTGNIDPNLAAALFALEVDRFEGTRAGVNPDDRTRMFESSAANSRFNGLLKALAVRNAEGDGERLLAVSEMARSRQLKELLTGSASLAFQSAATLDDPAGFTRRVQSRLSQGDVAIVYNLLPDELIAIVVEPGQIHIERKQITRDLYRDISGLHNSFSDPLSDPYTGLQRRVSEPLISMIEPYLSRAGHLYILPDGLMNTLPFSALQTSAGAMLIEGKTTLSVLPTMEWLLIDPASYSTDAPSLFAVADPDYPVITIPAAAGRSGNIQIPALPEAREEVDIISGIFEGNLLSFYGHEATKQQILNTDLSGFSHLHFATHGILANEVPGIYEPALVLAGDTQDDDAFLTSSDVERLSLNADVCVLSACNTGSGEVLRGEGVLGLSRSFMVAGCNTVVVSLWPVASDVTRDLMVAFYRSMSDGQTAAGAMRQAQLEVFTRENTVVETTRAFKISRTGEREDEQISASGNHPFFWAPFVIIGVNQ